MKLYYTTVNSSSFDEPKQQIKAKMSLGGGISSSIIPNTSLNNLFGDITNYSIANTKRNVEEYIAIALKNELSTKAENIKIWVEYPEDESNVCSFEIAVVDFNASGQMETIPNNKSKPYYAEFTANNTSETALDCGDLGIGVKMGIWIKRIIDISKVAEQSNNRILIDPLSPTVTEKPLDYEEIIKIHIEWD